MARFYWSLRVWILGIALVGALAGCGKESAPTASPQAPPVVSEEQHAPDASTPVPPILGAELASTELAPQAAPQTLEYQDQVKVTIPPGVLRGPARLSISSVAQPPEPFDPAFEQGTLFDISMGDVHEFDQDISIELALDTSRIRDDMPPDIALLAAYFDQEQQQWVSVPCEWDPAAKAARLTTRHLSVYALWYLGRNYHRFDLGDVRFYWNPAELGSTRNWAHSNGGNVTRKDTNGVTLPTYVDDAANAMNKVTAAYAKNLNLKPYSVPLDVFITGKSSPEHRELTGRKYVIFLSTNAAPGVTSRAGVALASPYDSLVYALGHESFHNVQLNSFSREQTDSLRWWMEVTAEWAGCRVALPGYPDMGKDGEIDVPSVQHFLNTSLLYAPKLSLSSSAPRQFHSYHAALFLDYLIRMSVLESGSPETPDAQIAQFRRLYDDVAVAKGTSNALAVTAQLDQTLHHQKLGFGVADAFDLFSAWYFLHQESPMATRSPQGLPPEALAGFDDLPADSGQKQVTFHLARNHVAKAYGVRLPADSSGQIRAVLLSTDLAPDDPLRFWAYVLPAGQRFSGHSIKEMQAQRQRIDREHPVTLAARPDDVIYVVATNNRLTAANSDLNTAWEAQRDDATLRIAPAPVEEEGGFWVLKDASVLRSGLMFHPLTSGGDTLSASHEQVGDTKVKGEQVISGSVVDNNASVAFAHRISGSLEWSPLPRILPVGSTWELQVTAQVQGGTQPATAAAEAGVSRLRQNQFAAGLAAPPLMRGCSFDVLTYPVLWSTFTRTGVVEGSPIAFGSGGGVDEGSLMAVGGGPNKRTFDGTSANSATFPISFKGSDNLKPGTLQTDEVLVLLLRAQSPGGMTYICWIYEFQRSPNKYLDELRANRANRSYRPPTRVKLTADAPASPPGEPGRVFLLGMRHEPMPVVAGTEALFEFQIRNPPAKPSYSWDFGEASFAGQPAAFTSTNQCRYTYSKGGTYNITVKVRDEANYNAKAPLAERTWTLVVDEKPVEEEPLMKFPDN